MARLHLPIRNLLQPLAAAALVFQFAVLGLAGQALAQATDKATKTAQITQFLQEAITLDKQIKTDLEVADNVCDKKDKKFKMADCDSLYSKIEKAIADRAAAQKKATSVEGFNDIAKNNSKIMSLVDTANRNQKTINSGWKEVKDYRLGAVAANVTSTDPAQKCAAIQARLQQIDKKMATLADPHTDGFFGGLAGTIGGEYDERLELMREANDLTAQANKIENCTISQLHGLGGAVATAAANPSTNAAAQASLSAASGAISSAKPAVSTPAQQGQKIINGHTRAVGTASGVCSGSTSAAPDDSLLGTILGGADMITNTIFGATLGSFGFQNDKFSIGVQRGCGTGAVFDGPGALAGLKQFKTNFGGNTTTSLIDVIVGWTNFALGFVGIIAITALIYAGFLYLTGGLDDGNIDKAKKIITYVVIGIIFIFMAYAIVNTFLSGNSNT